jgi:hypothetical protein
MPATPLLCRGVYDNFFGKILTFAAKTMHHTANKLQLGAVLIKNFASLDKKEEKNPRVFS